MENINKNKKKIELEECIQISEIKKEINKIILLYNTHNLVCSYEESVEIFRLNSQEKLDSLQKIIDPNFNTIEFLYETKENPNNKNYLLICSDMIHVFYLYDNDKKSILLQSINNFNYQYINQVSEKINGNVISLSNEYKISIFNNILISNDEIIDYNYIFDKGKNFIEKYKEEIYELEYDEINKKNEKIFSVIELFPDKLVYSFYIDNEDYFGDYEEKEEKEEKENINNNDEDLIYIKFLDNEYNEIKELLICEYDDGYKNMFQLNEMFMVFINDNYLFIIYLKYYEVIIKIKSNNIEISNFFQNEKNNFFNYLFLGVSSYCHELSNSENSDELENSDFKEKNDELKLKIYDLKYIQEIGIPIKFEIEYKEFSDKLKNISKILDMNIIEDKDDKNIYHCIMHNISRNINVNEGLNVIFLKFKIFD